MTPGACPGIEEPGNQNDRNEAGPITLRAAITVQPDSGSTRMDQGASIPDENNDVRTDQANSSPRDGFWRQGEKRIAWEMPLGVKRGFLDEPGPRFVDVEGEADKAACRWERAGSWTS